MFTIVSNKKVTSTD